MIIDMSYMEMRNRLMVDYAVMLLDQTGANPLYVGGKVAYMVSGAVAMAMGNADMIAVFEIDNEEKRRSFYQSWCNWQEDNMGRGGEND